MYFRYHVNYSSPKTRQPVGVFVAVWHLLEEGLLTEEETLEYWKTREFAEQEPPVPPFYSEGNPRGAVTWFKKNALAEGFVAKVPFYFNILQKYQVDIIESRTDNPGKIIYEDEFQIAAVKE